MRFCRLVYLDFTGYAVSILRSQCYGQSYLRIDITCGQGVLIVDKNIAVSESSECEIVFVNDKLYTRMFALMTPRIDSPVIQPNTYRNSYDPC